MNISHRHHFIPEFFIRGFIQPSKTIWVYDKTIDRISTNPRSPKSIFFESDRNTITVSRQEIDIIETDIYNSLDNLVGKRFRLIQKQPIEKIQETEFIQCVDLMAATMYYRTPATEDLIKNFTAENINEISSPRIKKNLIDILNLKINETDRTKLLNCVAPFINSYFFEKKLTQHRGYFKILETRNPCFILSDNPILYESLPKDFNDLTFSIIFPLTSNRIYYGIKGKTYSLNDKIAKSINILLALQSQKYFGSSDKTFLEIIVNAYRKIKTFELNIPNLMKQLFTMINK